MTPFALFVVLVFVISLWMLILDSTSVPQNQNKKRKLREYEVDDYIQEYQVECNGTNIIGTKVITENISTNPANPLYLIKIYRFIEKPLNLRYIPSINSYNYPDNDLYLYKQLTSYSYKKNFIYTPYKLTFIDKCGGKVGRIKRKITI